MKPDQLPAHAVLGASASKRWWNCPGSVEATRNLPDSTSVYAAEGTAAHSLAEMCLLFGHEAEEMVGRRFGEFTVDAEMAAAVQIYIDECRRTAAVERGPGAFREVELRVDLAKIKPPGPMYGTADFVDYIAAEHRLRVVDLKYGMGVQVQAAGNPQLKYYALGALLNMPAGARVDVVEATIVQPRAFGNPIRSVELDPIELMEWSIELIEHAEAALRPNAPFMAGAWCQFCKLSGRCAVQTNTALALTQPEFAVQPGLSAERIAWMLERIPVLKRVIADVQAAALAEIRAGRSVPGWKEVPTDPRVEWRDETVADRELFHAHNFTEAERYAPRRLISPAVARGVVTAKLLATRQAEHAMDGGKKPTKKQAEADARLALADLTITNSSGSKLAPENDPTPALPAAGSEFLSTPAISDK